MITTEVLIGSSTPSSVYAQEEEFIVKYCNLKQLDFDESWLESSRDNLYT